MQSAPEYRLGIDLGGTKIEGVLIDAGGNELKRERRPTPQGDYQDILRVTRDLLNSLHNDQSLPVGIGTPGSLSKTTSLMRNANSTCLNGQPLLEDFAAFLNRPVRIANDANCFTLSEAVDGAAKNAEVVFGVILGTGVGGGLCINGRIIDGINSISGEWGHTPLPALAQADRGRDCFCGREDCVETWLSGPGISQSYKALTGLTVSARGIASRADHHEPEAAVVMATFYEQLATALATVINIVDPDVVVFGGGISNIARMYEALPKVIARHVFSDHMATRFVANAHGDSSGVRGAAWLWP